MTRLVEQAEHLADLGVGRLVGLSASELVEHASALAGDDAHYDDGDDDSVLVVHPDWASPAVLAPLLRRDGKPGFVVTDMTDIDAFVPLRDLELPAGPLYLVTGVDRGDHLRNWSPVEALDAFTEAGRTPLTLNEGICWLLHRPELLEPNRCFMTIGSRKPTARGLDARTPAIWISGGTGRDGAENRGAPKVGWCWAGNRHTWLGFGSATARRGSDREHVEGARAVQL